MANPNRFSAINVDDNVGAFRKVVHSATNNVSNNIRSVHLDNPFKGNGAWDRVRNMANSTASVVGRGAPIVGVVGGVASAMAVPGVTGAFVLAMAGPQAGLAGAVIAVALLLNEAHSDREAAHRELRKHVWSLVDDMPPPSFTTLSLEKAAKAAATLVQDGKHQLDLHKGKLDAAYTRFAVAGGKMDELREKLKRAKSSTAAVNIKEEAQQLWDKEIAAGGLASTQGGAFFEYVRRCVHTANYLQAHHILSLAIMEQCRTGSVVGATQNDFFGGSPLAEMRNGFNDADRKLRVLLQR